MTNSSTKGQYALIASIALFLLVLAILLFFMSDFFTSSEESTWKASCKASVQGQVYQGSPIVCPLQQEDISQESDREEEIAKMLQTCWEIYGEGEHELFNPIISKYCAICYVVDIGNEPVEIADYLATRRMPLSSTYYTDYFATALNPSDLTNVKGRIAILYTEQFSLEGKQVDHRLRVTPYDEQALINLGCDVVDVQQQ